MLTLEDVTVLAPNKSKRRNDAGNILSQISLVLSPGERVAIVGPSGAGKSTLLRVMCMAQQPGKGHVNFLGVDPWLLSSRRLQCLRRQIHLAPQAELLIDKQRVVTSVLAALLPTRSLWFALRSLLSPSEQDTHRVYEVLDKVAMSHKLWENSHTLSGGEKQRVALARALISPAQALFVDEPASALDPAQSERVLTLLIQHAIDQNQLLVCSLHQPDLAKNLFSRVIGIREGSIAFDVPSQDLDSELIGDLYREQSCEVRRVKYSA